MKTLNYSAVTAQQAAKHVMDLLKLEAALNAAASDGLFLQIHDLETTPAEGSVPKKWWSAAECGYKDFTIDPLHLENGCYVCLSTTGPTKTLAAGGSDLMDELQLEFAAPELDADSYVGDLSTGVAGLQVWASASGPKRLLGVQTVNPTGADVYLQLFAKDSPSNGDTPLMVLGVMAAGARKRFDFGRDGLDVQQVISSTVNKGCTLACSTTQRTLTAAAASFYLRGEVRS